MRNRLLIYLSALLSIAGCARQEHYVSSNECMGCKRLEEQWKILKESGYTRVVFLRGDSNEPADEGPIETFEAAISNFAGCCASEPLSNEWVQYNRLDCIWENLENERVQKISFCQPVWHDLKNPDNWHPWADVSKPERIKELVVLMHKAMEKSSDKFANEDAIASITGALQIITDKHKYIIPVCAFKGAVCGRGWTSYELMDRLEYWGFHTKSGSK